MATMVRWAPFSELASLHNEMSRFMNGLLEGNGRHRLRSAPLEAPNRVECLDLQRHRAPERLAERRARQRRRVEECRIDHFDRSADPIEPEPNTRAGTAMNV